ncbi:MAG TPA: hypothetical protein VFO34_11260 [Candidatus Acidoferrales bacterium]|nr:hypothetical protein [Candidatus Acidoferrales bacterium]
MRTTATNVILACSLVFFSVQVDTSRRNARANSFPTAQRVAPEERSALADLFKATGGEHWKKKDGWLGTPGTECSWYGVECFDAGGESSGITGLELYANDLEGQIPPSFAHLSHLKSLNVYGNHLSGTLPDSLIERWLAGHLAVIAEPALLTDVSEIDYRFDPSALLCGQQELILRSNSQATSFTTKCRNATPRDRVTYCEVKEGHIYSEFPRLSWLIEKSGYFALEPSYSTSVTDGAFEFTRVIKAGKAHEIEDYAEAGPFALWTVHRSIEGVATSLSWESVKRLPKCPSWDSLKNSPTP